MRDRLHDFLDVGAILRLSTKRPILAGRFFLPWVKLTITSTNSLAVRASAREPDRPPVVQQLMEEGELAKAGTRLAELLQRSPNNASGLNLLGVVDA